MLILIKYTYFRKQRRLFLGQQGPLPWILLKQFTKRSRTAHNQSNKTTQTTRNDLTAQVYSTLLKSNPNIFYDKCIKSDLNIINC